MRVDAELGSSRRARRSENVGRVVGLHRRERAVAINTSGEEVLPPHLQVTTDIGAVGQASLDHDGLDNLARPLVLKRATDKVVERHVAAAPVGGIGAEDRLGLGQLDPLGDRPGAEASEDHQMHRANPGAGEHQRDRLIVGRHVDRDAVTALNPDRPQRGGHALDIAQQLRVGVDPLSAVLVQADQRSAPAIAVGDLRVQARVREIRLAAEEPSEGRNLLRRPLEHFIPFAEPGDPSGSLRPERIRFVERPSLDVSHDRSEQINV